MTVVVGSIRKLEKGRICETKPISDLAGCATNIDYIFNSVTVLWTHIRKRHIYSVAGHQHRKNRDNDMKAYRDASLNIV